jgi:hypothetical protein
MAYHRAWGEALLAHRSDIDRATLDRFLDVMWANDFVISVTPEFIATIETPMMVLPGIDGGHPPEVGREVARLARNAEVVEPWKEPAEAVAPATERIREFLRNHTPH